MQFFKVSLLIYFYARLLFLLYGLKHKYVLYLKDVVNISLPSRYVSITFGVSQGSILGHK